ncbi:50S ribosomal protein L3 [Candidatus Uhrbacteria bacterium]|nr:50S ribosomal protein L3 [Candidatus Uhrbacteria bacterium]
MKYMIGSKEEMSQEFLEDGTVTPVTLVRVEPNVVTDIRTIERDGYVAVQLGTRATAKPLSRPELGHLKGLPNLQTIVEVRVPLVDKKKGDIIDVTHFSVGDRVDVMGTSKGRGFQGVVRRHHFRGSPATHGHKDQLRMPGSIASHRQGPVIRGQRMGGRMGGEQVTVKNLEIVAVYPEKNIVAIKGAVPGARGTLLMVMARDSKTIWQK